MNTFELRIKNCFLPQIVPVAANSVSPTYQHFAPDRAPLRIPNETFDDVIIYLTVEEKQKLLKTLEELPDRDTQVEAVKKTLDEGHQLTSLFQQPNFPLYALLALKEGKISGMAFTTSQLFYNVHHCQPNEGEIRTVPIFNGEAINEEARTMVDDTTKIGSGIIIPPGSEIEKFITRFKEFIEKENGVKMNHQDMNPEQTVTFFELLRKLPPLEQQYLVVPEPNPPEFTESGVKAAYINQRLQQIGFNVFTHQIGTDGKIYRIIPSKGMIQAYLLARAPEDAPQLVTRFKLAALDDMHEMILEDQRPLCLDVTFLESVEEADRRKCNRKTNDVTTHDFYHGNVMADIPRKERKKLYAIAEILKQGLKRYLEPPTLIERLQKAVNPQGLIPRAVLKKIEKAIDQINEMEHTEYRRVRLLNIKITDSLFWTVIERCVESEEPSEVSKESPEALKWINQCIVKALIENGDYYRSRFGLGAESLKDLLKTLKEAGCHLHDPLEEALTLEVNAQTFFILVERCTKGSSYLVRDRALQELKSRLALENVELVIECARIVGSHAVIKCATEFVADHLSEFVKKFSQGVFKQDTSDFILSRIQTSPHFEYVIKTAIYEKDYLVFAFLMQGEKFIKSIINKVFDDKFTLLQSALFRMDSGLVSRLLSLGATPNLQPGQGTPSPAFIAANSGNKDMYISLVALGAKMTSSEISRFNLNVQKAVALQRRVTEGMAQNNVYKFDFDEFKQWAVLSQWGSGASASEAERAYGHGLEFLPDFDTFSGTLDRVD